MRALRALPMLILLFAAGGLGAHAEEEAGIRCDLHALVDADDAGLLSIYDGLRKGLELAQLPRVCRDEPDESGVAGFVERRAAHAAPRREAGLAVEPFFAVGDRSCGAVAATGTDLPWVGALVRYTAERTPLQPLPQPRRGAIVYAHLSLEQVGETLRAALGEGARSVRLATSVDEPLRAAWTKATGLAVEPSAAGVAAVVDLRLDPAAAAPSFEEALA
ncbi:MAG: hypothetical protein O2894_13690, partial [Planctomycetota bacterium]|nr:hypothetical protein [Planctomycetota bacterium]